MVGPIATKFGTLTQFDRLDHSISKIGPTSCTFDWFMCMISRVHFQKAFAVQNDKIAYLNLAIKQQITANIYVTRAQQ